MFETNSLYILVIEDNEGDWILIKEYLKEKIEEKFIDHCSTLANAILYLSKKKYDVILLDVSLPDSNGNESVEKVLSYAQDAPVMVLTGYSDKLFAIGTLKSGVQDYLLKDEVTTALLFKSINYSIERNNVKIKIKADEKKRAIEMADAIVSAQQGERSVISSELHDNIIQLLTGCRMFLNVAKKGGDKAPLILEQTDDALKVAIVEIRKLSHALAPPDYTGILFEEALDDLINKFKTSSGVEVFTNWNDIDFSSLSNKITLNIFRIVQEQLNNIINHAQAKKIQISIHLVGSLITLIITDDGIGFNTSMKSKGIGLENIRTRTALFNGEMEIISSPSKGCTLKVKLKNDLIIE